MEQELLQALAEAKSYIKEWAKLAPKNKRWLPLANDISRLQLELAKTNPPEPLGNTLISEVQEYDSPEDSEI